MSKQTLGINGVSHFQLTSTAFDALADLRTLPLADNSNWTDRATAIVFGAVSAFDGSFFIYAWDPTSATVDDGSNYIKPDAITGNGRWRLIVGSSGGGLFVEFLAEHGSPEGVVVGHKQGQIYVDLDTGDLYKFIGTPGQNTGWV